ncbi:MAG: hypothetical protein ACKV1O_11535 [Saprospiraceae bacterium]
MYPLMILKEAVAIHWWKLYAKRIEEDVRTDHEKRKFESEKVRNQLRFSA